MDQEEAEGLAQLIERETWVVWTHAVARPTSRRYIIIAALERLLP